MAPAFDPQRARQLYRQGVQELGNEPASIELLSYDDSTARDVATFLQLQDNLGIKKVDVKIQPFDQKLELESNGEFQLSWQGWIGDYNDPMTFLDLWLSDNAFNTQKYANDRYDRLITDAQSEADAARRMDMLLEAERLLVEVDAAMAPLFFEGEVYLIEPFIKNYVNHPYGGGIDISKWRAER